MNYSELIEIIPIQDRGKLRLNLNQTIKYSIFEFNLYKVIIASTSVGICNVLIGNSSKEVLSELQKGWGNSELVQKELESHDLAFKLIKNRTLDKKLTLNVKGSGFQIKVWTELIKQGLKLSTYKDISNALGVSSYRAIGRAISKNPVAYIIPCHRVIYSSGKYGNYRWGANLKIELIKHDLLNTLKN